MAEEADRQMKRGDIEPWLRRLESEHDNFRTALAWAGTDTGDAEAGLRLVGALGSFWNVRGHFSEGRQHLRRALERKSAQEATSVRAQALNSAGNLACNQGDLAEARALHEEALVIFRTMGDPTGIANTLNNLGNLSDPSSRRAIYEECLAIYRELGDTRGIALVIGNLGNTIRTQGDHTGAQALIEESLILFRTLGDKQNIGRTLCNLGNMALLRGDTASAAALLEEGLSIRRELGDQKGTAWALSVMGGVAKLRGDHAEAQALFEEGLSIRRDIGDKLGEAWALSHLGEVARSLGNLAEARVLLEESLTLFREAGRQAGECVGALPFRPAGLRDGQQHRSADIACGKPDTLPGAGRCGGPSDRSERLRGAVCPLRAGQGCLSLGRVSVSSEKHGSPHTAGRACGV